MEEDGPYRHQGNAQKQDQPVQGADHLGFLPPGVGLGLPGQLCRAGVRPHGGKLHPAPAGEDQAAGMDPVPRELIHAVLLAGEEGLVDMELPGAQDPVGADLVPLAELGHVVPDDALRVYRQGCPIPDDLHRPPGHQGQLLHRPLGPDLLDDADDGVDDHNPQKSHVFRGGPANQQQNRQKNENKVKECQAVTENDLPLAEPGPLSGAPVEAGIQPVLDLLGAEPPLRVNVEGFDGIHKNISPFLSTISILRLGSDE